MVLYFDSYITDIPLPGRGRSQLKEDIRKYTKAYALPTRVALTKYTLASYALYPWSYVLIRYELDDQNGYKAFDEYIKKLFPKAQILHKRSATQEEYKKSLKILEKLPDKWIFYSPNNDHPLISYHDNVVDYINKLLQKATDLKKNNKFVSIMYSHFSEFLNIPVKGTPNHFLQGKGTSIIEDNETERIYKKPKGDFSSVQIVHIDHFKHWFNSVNVGDKRVIRAEDIRHDVIIDDQIIIVPKIEIFGHFDRYEYLIGLTNEIQNDQIPPMIIPTGFFEKKIKIAYGYDTYREGWLNINPAAKKYSFRDAIRGTDLKISISQLPKFWLNCIMEIDRNKNADEISLNKGAQRTESILRKPWKLSNQGFKITTIRFWTRYYLFRFVIALRMTASFLGGKKLLKRLNMI